MARCWYQVSNGDMLQTWQQIVVAYTNKVEFDIVVPDIGDWFQLVQCSNSFVRLWLRKLSYLLRVVGVAIV